MTCARPRAPTRGERGLAAGSRPARARPPVAGPRARRPGPVARSRRGSRAARRHSTCGPEAARLQEPVQGRIRGGQPGRDRRARRARRLRGASSRRQGQGQGIGTDHHQPGHPQGDRAGPDPEQATQDPGTGELSTPLFVVADAFGKSAVAKIEAAGGSVNVLEIPTRPTKALGVETTPAKAGATPEAPPRRRSRPPRPPTPRTPSPRPSPPSQSAAAPRPPRRPRRWKPHGSRAGRAGRSGRARRGYRRRRVGGDGRERRRRRPG